MLNKRYLLLTIILFLFIFNIDVVITSVFNSTALFYNKVFITVFPFIILSDILIFYDYHIFLSKNIGKLLSKIFNIDEKLTIVFILSLLTSMPCNSIYLKSLLDNNEVDSSSYKILYYTYFPSISFVIGISVSLYNSFTIGIILLITNYSFNIAVGIYLRKNNTFGNNIISIIPKSDFFSMLKDSINKSINTCIIILGNIIIFNIIINLFNSIININPIICSIISGLFEITTGLNSISALNIPMYYKIIISSFMINFSGLSILFQSKSILSKYNINIKKILIIKLVFSFIFLFLLSIFLHHIL